MTQQPEAPNRSTAILSIIGVALGALVAILARDVIIGVIAGSVFIALTVSMLRLWTRGGTQRPRHP